MDVLNVIRDQAVYFQPQRKTKVMNEGWASFWHMRIMTRLFQDGFLTAEELVDIIAYMMLVSGAPAGDHELAAAPHDLARITIERRPGDDS